MWAQTGSLFPVEKKKAFAHFRRIWIAEFSLKAILYVKHWKIAHSGRLFIQRAWGQLALYK